MHEAPGASFKASEVVNLYRHRPPYPTKVYDRIVEHSPSMGRLLDLGCGEGKVARPMTEFFDHVVAVDPSAHMIELGRSLENGWAENLEWIEATAEEAPLNGEFDTVTFASSIHWMDPGRLFSTLDKHLSRHHVLAIIAGDTAFEPPWHEEWRRFLAKWVPEVTGQPLDSDEWCTSRTRYLDYVDVVHTEDLLSKPLQQTVESFILCQQSRDTFALSKLGSRRPEFHDELEALLHPYANRDGQLTYQVKTQLTLATRKAV